MDDNNGSDSTPDSQNEKKNILRTIFLNLFICVFIIMCYFYFSELFGSVSTIFVYNSEFIVHFGFTLLLLTFFSILAGKFHGFIAGFMGELLYQLAYYDMLYINWCLITAIWGFMCGIYKYKPLRYQNLKGIGITVLILLLSSIVTTIFVVAIQNINLGFTFFVEALLSVILIVPVLLYAYDKVLASNEKHLYYLCFAHHPISAIDHTFYFKFGKTYIYFCSRCSGVMIGGMIAVFSVHLMEVILEIDFMPEIAVMLCIILPIPGLIDWGSQRLLLRKSTTESRLFTGFIIGSALYFMTLTREYYFFHMIFLLIFYFSIFGLLVFFGYKKEMKLLKEDLEKQYPSADSKELK